MYFVRIAELGKLVTLGSPGDRILVHHDVPSDGVTGGLMHVKPQKLPCWKKQRLIPVFIFHVTINYYFSWLSFSLIYGE